MTECCIFFACSVESRSLAWRWRLQLLSAVFDATMLHPPCGGGSGYQLRSDAVGATMLPAIERTF